MKGTFHVTSSASAVFPLTQDPALGGLLALGTQDTAGGSVGCFLSPHRAPAGWTRIRTKEALQTAICHESEKKGIWLEETSGGFCVCGSCISTSSESGRMAPRGMSNVSFTTRLPEIKGKLDTASIFCSNIDLALLSQIGYWFLGSPLVSGKRANPSFMFVYIPYWAGAQGALFTLICKEEGKHMTSGLEATLAGHSPLFV